MNNNSKEKEKGGAKLALGVYEVASGVALAAGKGLLAKVIHAPVARGNLGAKEVKSGMKHIQEGWKEWKSE